MLASSICGCLSIAAYTAPQFGSEDHHIAFQKRTSKQKNKAVASATSQTFPPVELIEELEEEQNDEELDLDNGNKLQNFQDNKEHYEDENSSKFYIER